MFNWRNSERYRYFVHNNTSSVATISEFVNEIKRDSKYRNFQFIIESKSKNLPVGIIFTHNASSENGFCFLNVFISERYRQKWYCIEALALLLRHLFEIEKFYKVYIDVLENNELSLSTIRSCKFIEEGRFVSHKVINGLRYDVLRFAVYKNNCSRLESILEHYQ